MNKIRTSPEEVKKGISSKKSDPALVDRFLKLDGKWRVLTTKFDETRSEQKKLGEAKKIEEAKKLKEKLKELESELAEIEKQRTELLYKIPNLPFEDVPVGKDETDNKVIRSWGEIPKFTFKPKDHMQLG